MFWIKFQEFKKKINQTARFIYKIIYLPLQYFIFTLNICRFQNGNIFFDVRKRVQK
ncbi:hypothetical protein SAMN05428971_2802 [Candidatus Pantoea varia]|uniref:Uncharacterized protein n=1 Tax=Candidatus Pantoea varia TaxID=1881036 RepID=A0A1I5E6L4_9GAMM|nr:hypothetical protein SAMN05428971_2802 [Pantoea varia]